MAENISHLPEQKRRLLEEIVGKLSRIPGVSAVVLGGSYASGTHHARSDMDIGIYYFEANPFLISEIRWVADLISADRSATVTGFYEWGAWVNGGAWIHTQQGKVDFLYRNLDQVVRTIDEAQQGISHHDYDQQPTFGFYSVIYLAETQVCIPLYDPGEHIAKLKQQVTAYPSKLKQRIIADTLWSAEFTLSFARDYASQGDIYNTVGCFTRVASNLTQTLFALNERYYMQDKQILDAIATFPNLPPGYIQQVNHILACPGNTAQALKNTCRDLEKLWQSVVSLPGVDYQPKF